MHDHSLGLVDDDVVSDVRLVKAVPEGDVVNMVESWTHLHEAGVAIRVSSSTLRVNIAAVALCLTRTKPPDESTIFLPLHPTSAVFFFPSYSHMFSCPPFSLCESPNIHSDLRWEGDWRMRCGGWRWRSYLFSPYSFSLFPFCIHKRGVEKTEEVLLYLYSPFCIYILYIETGLDQDFRRRWSLRYKTNKIRIKVLR